MSTRSRASPWWGERRTWPERADWLREHDEGARLQAEADARREETNRAVAEACRRTSGWFSGYGGPDWPALDLEVRTGEMVWPQLEGGRP